ncbi:hypothetical protein D9M73_260370 [compost metagenome]
MTTAVEAQGVFHLEDFGQRQVPGPDDLLPYQMRGQRRAFAQSPGRAAEQQVAVVAQGADGLPGATHIADIQ